MHQPTSQSILSKVLSPSWKQWTILPLTAASVLGLTLAVGTMTVQNTRPVLAQERTMRTITVSGQGLERISTTLSQVQLGVEVQGKTAEEVQQQIAKRSSAVVELLRSRNVEKLETTGIRLNPVYSYENNTQRLTGYSGANIVSFRVATDRAGDIIDDAVQAGATRIDSISFTATDEAIAEAQKQALRKATQDARQQADAVLQTLNLSPKEIISIQVNGANVPPPPPVLERAVAAQQADNFSTPVIGGEQQVNASVTLQIQY